MNKKILMMLMMLGFFLMLIVDVSASDRYEYYTTGDDSIDYVYGTNYFGQAFTIGTTGANIPIVADKIAVKIYRIGSPNTMNITITTTSSNLPTAIILGTGTIDGNSLGTGEEWVNITITPTILHPNTQYSFYLSAPSGDSSNKVVPRYDSGGATYGGGDIVTSSNSGSSWNTYSGQDMVFEIYGSPVTLTDNLMAYWNYNEGSGTTSSNSVNSSLYNLGVDNSWTAIGKIRSGYNPSNTQKSSSGINLGGQKELTYNVWMKRTDTLSGGQVILSNGKAQAIPSGKLVVYTYFFASTPNYPHMYISNNADLDCYPTNPLPLNEWAMLTIAINSSGASQYLNGVLNCYQSLTVPFTIWEEVDMYSFSLHSNYASGGGYWQPNQVLVDEAGFWNRALNPTEISSLYNDGKGLTYETLVPSWTSDLNNQLVAYYNFENNTNGLTDIASGLHNGTLINSPSLTTGKLGNAYGFDGVNQYVSVADENALDINYYSISAWVKVNNNALGTILSKGYEGSGTAYLFWRNPVTTGDTKWGSYTGGWHAIDYDTFSSPTSWYHAVLVHNATGLGVWINGVLVSSSSDSFSAPSNNANITIGADSNSGVVDYWLNGTIDELGLWNRSLTPAEITKIYNYGAGLTYVPTPTWKAGLNTGLTHYWNFNEPSGTIAEDKVGTYNFSLVGAGFDSGRVGNAITCDGSDYANFTGMNGIDGKNWSFSYWVKPTTNTNWAVLLSGRGDWALTDYYIALRGSGIAHTDALMKAGVIAEIPYVIPTTDWTHLIWTSDGSRNYIYVNGVMTNNVTNTYDWSANTGMQLCSYSASEGDWRQFYNGKIDELGIWSRTLNSSEVLDLYNSGAGMTYVPAGEISTYEITNCTQLQDMNLDLTRNYVLMNNIDCSDTINWNGGEGFIPIANFSDCYGECVPNQFSGSLDGQGYNITDLFENRTDYRGGSLIGWLTGEIKNVGVTGNIICESIGCDYTGGLAGISYPTGKISNSYFIGNVQSGIEFVGGLVGDFSGELMNNSYFIGNVISPSDTTGVGGLAGNVGAGDTSTKIINSYATGNVTGGDGTGGLAGFLYTNMLIENSYFIGNVTGNFNVGGLVGNNLGTITTSYATGNVNNIANNGGGLVGYNNGIINNSFATGSVSGGNIVGGLAGTNEESGEIINCYATGNVFGSTGTGGLVAENYGSITNSYSAGKIGDTTSNAGGLAGYSEGTCTNSYWNKYLSEYPTSACGTELTNAEILNQSSYTDWDFTNIWNIETNSTPYLRFNPVPFFPIFLISSLPNVTLTSPDDNYVAITSPVNLNCSVTSANGTTISNVSLWTNSTGVWEINQTQTFGGVIPASLITFETIPPLNTPEDSITDLSGEKITMNKNGYLTSFVKDSYVTATNFYVKNMSDTVLASGTFVGNVATISGGILLEEGQSYKLLVDSGGGSYNTINLHSGGAQDGAGYEGTYFNWTGGNDVGSSFSVNYFYDFIMVAMSDTGNVEPLITHNSLNTVAYDTGYNGENVYTGVEVKVLQKNVVAYNMTKESTVTATACAVYSVNYGRRIVTGTFTGDVCQFNHPIVLDTSDTYHFEYTINEVTLYHNIYTSIVPNNDNYISWIKGATRGDGTTDEAYMYGVTAIGTQATQFITGFTDTMADRDWVYDANWFSQSFDVSSFPSFSINKIAIRTYRIGLPDMVNFYLKEADGSGNPTGTILSSGTINASQISESIEWVDVIMTPYTLDISKNYTYVVSVATSLTVNNRLSMEYYLGNIYAGGIVSRSGDSGSSWTPDNTYDANFMIYGTAVSGLPAVLSANVSFSFIPTNPNTLWSCQACDNESNCGFASENRTLLYNPTPPSVNITFPEPFNYTFAPTTLNYTYEGSPTSCWYSTDGGVTNISTTCGIVVTGLTASQGWNTWAISIEDAQLRKADSSVNFYVDSIAPTITPINPANNTFTNNTTQNFTAEINDTGIGLANATLNIYNQTGLYNQTTIDLGGVATSIVGIPVLLVDGFYNWFFNVFDILGNQAVTENNTLTIDTITPAISIVYPQDANYTSKPTQLDYTLSDINPDTCWYSLDSGATNISITCGNNVTGLSANEGINTWLVSIQDKAGNVNSSSATFFVDSVAPTIQYVAPTETDNSYITRTNLYVNVTASDTNLKNITTRLYLAGTLINSQTTTTSPNYYSYGGLANGIYTFNGTACDILDTCTELATRTTTVDILYPLISFGAGTLANGVNKSQNNIYINTSWAETNFFNITFRTNSNVQNFVVPTYDYNFTGLANGIYSYSVTICDKVGYCNTTETRTITLDVTNPTGQQGVTGSGGSGGGFVPSVNGSYYPNAKQNFTANVTDSESGIKNVTITITNQTGIVNQTTQTYGGGIFSTLFGIPITLIDGVYNWFVTATDVAGNFITTNVLTFFVDTTPPAFSGSGNINSVWEKGSSDTRVYHTQVTIAEPNLIDKGINFEGTNYSLYNAGGNSWAYNFTKILSYAPYTSPFFWWAIDNATHYSQSQNHSFVAICVGGFPLINTTHNTLGEWKTFNNSLCMEKMTMIQLSGGGGGGGEFHAFGEGNCGGGEFHIQGGTINCTQFNYYATRYLDIPMTIPRISDIKVSMSAVDGSPALSNVSMITNNIGIYTSNGTFNSTNARTENFAGVINMELQACINQNPLNLTGYCRMPIAFLSSSAGTLQFYDLEWTTLGFYENAQYYTNSTLEGISENFVINISYDSKDYAPYKAFLIYDGVSYQGIQNGIGNDITFSRTIAVPNVNATLNKSFYWTIGFTSSSGTTYYNSSTQNQQITNLDIDDCSSYSTLIYNITIYNQDDKTVINPSSNNTKIDATLLLSGMGTFNQALNKSKQWLNLNPAKICINQNLSNFTYRADLVISYEATGFVQQFYYMDNGVLTNHTNPNIKLYDLPLSESTSFLVTYQDENYLYVKDAVIEVWRKYIGDGQFLAVEHGKTDAGGQTRLNLITESIIYKFLVWKDGVLQYTSPEYLALCQASPCQINLRKPFSESEASVSIYGNIASNLDYNESQKKITFTFSTTDGSQTTMIMNITKVGEENTSVFSDSATSSGGTLVYNVPSTLQNTTYLIEISKDGSYFGQKTFSLLPKSQDIFGSTGLILTALAFLTLALMGISSGIAVIVFGIIGLVFAGLLSIFESGNILGVGSAIVWLIVAGIIIIWKISNRRVS